MNQIKAIQRINDIELENGILSPELSWHEQYKDQAYIFVGGLERELTEGDVLTIFSQFGVPVDILLVRDRETGESKGFGYLKYEDQRSTILAVDNLNGARIAGKAIKVDHALYAPRDDDWQYRNAVQEELSKDKLEVPSNRQIGETAGKQDASNLADPMASYADTMLQDSS